MPVEGMGLTMADGGEPLPPAARRLIPRPVRCSSLGKGSSVMSCPFLREGRARYCHAAPLRKLILDGPDRMAADGVRRTGITNARWCKPARRRLSVLTGGDARTVLRRVRELPSWCHTVRPGSPVAAAPVSDIASFISPCRGLMRT